MTAAAGAPDEVSYVVDWSPIPSTRYDQAQAAERTFWSAYDRTTLVQSAHYYFYAGYYNWHRHRNLLNPFRVDPSRRENFQIRPEEMDGTTVLDLGCGPTPWTLSLVHCAAVHVVDPLLAFYREIQPFGWKFFASQGTGGAEQLPFPDASIDFVHCWNVLDHTRDADTILGEIVRVLRPAGRLLLACDLRGDRGGGPAHPYLWSLDAFETRIARLFEPVTEPVLGDHDSPALVPRHEWRDHLVRWTAALRPKPLQSS